MSAARWIRLLCLIGLVASSTTARAQVFKPRGAKTGPAAKATAQPPAPTAVARKGAPGAPGPTATAPAAAASKKPTRATGPTPRRIVTTTPAKKPRGTAKARADAEDAVVIDDDEDDVTITDD